MDLRKCSLRERYAPLESESVLAQADLSRLLNRRNACGHHVVNYALICKYWDLLPSNISSEAQ